MDERLDYGLDAILVIQLDENWEVMKVSILVAMLVDDLVVCLDGRKE